MRSFFALYLSASVHVSCTSTRMPNLKHYLACAIWWQLPEELKQSHLKPSKFWLQLTFTTSPYRASYFLFKQVIRTYLVLLHHSFHLINNICLILLIFSMKFSLLSIQPCFYIPIIHTRLCLIIRYICIFQGTLSHSFICHKTGGLWMRG